MLRDLTRESHSNIKAVQNEHRAIRNMEPLTLVGFIKAAIEMIFHDGLNLRTVGESGLSIVQMESARTPPKNQKLHGVSDDGISSQ